MPRLFCFLRQITFNPNSPKESKKNRRKEGGPAKKRRLKGREGRKGAGKGPFLSFPFFFLLRCFVPKTESPPPLLSFGLKVPLLLPLLRGVETVGGEREEGGVASQQSLPPSVRSMAARRHRALILVVSGSECLAVAEYEEKIGKRRRL